MDEETLFKFIEQVHNNQCLWNITSRSYHDKLLRDDLWNSIGVEFNISGTDAYRTFRRLREKYRREADKQRERSGEAESEPSNWPYLKSLSFLDVAYRKRKGSNSQTLEQEELSLKEDLIESMDELPSVVEIVKELPVPIEQRLFSTCSNSKIPPTGDTIAEVLKETTKKIITAFHTDSRHEEVITFIRGTFNSLDDKVAKNFEKELMNVSIKYRLYVEIVDEFLACIIKFGSTIVLSTMETATSGDGVIHGLVHTVAKEILSTEDHEDVSSFSLSLQLQQLHVPLH